MSEEARELALREGGSPPGSEGTSSHGSSADGHIRKGAPIRPVMPPRQLQGTPDWFEKRRGKITASKFSDVMTPPRGKKDRENGVMGATARSYMLEIIAEILTGQTQGHKTTTAEQWGIDHEPGAADVYAERMGVGPQEVGFIVHPDDAMVGGSPDRLIGDDGGLEIKCPFNSAIHIKTIYDGVMPKERIAQVQGSLWVTGRKWWDFVSYDPRLKDLRLALFCVKIARDEEYIARLAQAVGAFRETLLSTLCTIKQGVQS